MTTMLMSNPREDGYFMPAEYMPHSGTWMAWPERCDNWRLGAKPAQAAFAAVAFAIAQFEPVTVCVSGRQYHNARTILSAKKSKFWIRVVEMTVNDSWMRDIGPTFVVSTTADTTPRGIDWRFNAWGGLYNGLYFPWDQDDAVAQKIIDIERCLRYRAPIVLEGGSVHVDGEGTCMTTEECLLSPGRNPNLTKTQIEEHLKEFLNVQKVLWVPRGVYNDETDGHIDNMACFAAPGVVLLTWTDDPDDPQYERSLEALNYLTAEGTVDAKGRRLQVIRIHQPTPVLLTSEEAEGIDYTAGGRRARQAGERQAASYVNFYICNGGVIVPLFNDPKDADAVAALQRAFPQRQVVGVAAREILLGGGNIHCITQQQP